MRNQHNFEIGLWHFDNMWLKVNYDDNADADDDDDDDDDDADDDDDDIDNIDVIHDKNDQKTHKYYDIWVKND